MLFGDRNDSSSTNNDDNADNKNKKKVVKIKENEREVESNKQFADHLPRGAQLVLNYAFVLDTEREQLQRFVSKPGYHILKTDDDTLTGFIADMAHWSKDIDDLSLVDELDDLCARLDDAYFYGSIPFRLLFSCVMIMLDRQTVTASFYWSNVLRSAGLNGLEICPSIAFSLPRNR